MSNWIVANTKGVPNNEAVAIGLAWLTRTIVPGTPGEVVVANRQVFAAALGELVVQLDKIEAGNGARVLGPNVRKLFAEGRFIWKDGAQIHLVTTNRGPMHIRKASPLLAVYPKSKILQLIEREHAPDAGLAVIPGAPEEVQDWVRRVNPQPLP